MPGSFLHENILQGQIGFHEFSQKEARGLLVPCQAHTLAI